MGSASSVQNWPSGPLDKDMFKAISGNYYHENMFDVFSRNGIIERSFAEDLIQIVQYIHITKFEKLFALFEERKMKPITMEDLKEFIKIAGFTPTKDDLMDLDGKRTVTLRQFLAIISTKVKAVDIKVLEAFQKVDTNHDGYASLQEFKQLISVISSGKVIEEDVILMIKNADLDGDGQINIEEFRDKIYPSFIAKIDLVESAVLDAFRKFDISQDGLVSASEFKAIIIQMSNHVIRSEDVDHMLASADLNNDGNIDIEEFKVKIYPEVAEKMKKIDIAVFEAFQMFDVNNDGSITKEEFSKVVKNISGDEISESEIARLLKLADQDNDGLIDIEEFRKKIYPRLAKTIRETDAKVSAAFDEYDVDKNGVITPIELRKILSKILGTTVSSKQIENIINAVDLDRDGKLNINEFKRKFYHRV